MKRATRSPTAQWEAGLPCSRESRPKLTILRRSTPQVPAKSLLVWSVLIAGWASSSLGWMSVMGMGG